MSVCLSVFLTPCAVKWNFPEEAIKMRRIMQSVVKETDRRSAEVLKCWSAEVLCVTLSTAARAAFADVKQTCENDYEVASNFVNWTGCTPFTTQERTPCEETTSDWRLSSAAEPVAEFLRISVIAVLIQFLWKFVCDCPAVLRNNSKFLTALLPTLVVRYYNRADLRCKMFGLCSHHLIPLL